MKNSLIYQLINSLIFFLISICSYGNVRLPVLISDGMVLQRDTKINIWGWVSPGEKVRVNFDKRSFSAATDPDGNWKIELPPMKAGGIYTMEVKGGGDLNYFAIAGADTKFVWANAIIEKNHVVVWSDEIPDLIWVRYAWADNPESANLSNMEGLPASPFEAAVECR